MNDHSAHMHDDSSSEHGGSSGQSSRPDPKEHPRQYFLPGKIIVHVDHPAGIDPRELAILIDNRINDPELGFGLEPGTIKKVQPRNILTFPRQHDQEQVFSIVPVELKSSTEEDSIKVLQQIYNKLKGGPLELTMGVLWQSVSPNWLLGSATHSGSHPPSPGSWPLAKPAPKEKDWKFSLIESDPNNPRELPFATEKGGDVHVAILDTAPCANDLDEAYETWQGKNELIDRLLKPEPIRKLRLVTDIYAEIELLDCSLARHRYWIADHGLFIAGEIASIAPESTMIHLYKVFTSYGSASTLTLAQGLLRILTDLTDGTIGRPLIVNCSFGLAAPDPNDLDFSVYFQDFPLALRNSDILEHMQTSLRALFDELTNQDQVIVVAAAGDDTEEGDNTEKPPRAPARLPAAYDSVIGVGALPKGFPLENDQYKAASYSNLADNPSNTGYMTLGGEPGPGKGILGLYTSEIPKIPGATEGKRPKDPKEATRDHLIYKQNQDGSTEWAGASFAAPIITGLVANWCSQQISAGGLINLANVRQALIAMSQSKTTAAGEHVILVKQG